MLRTGFFRYISIIVAALALNTGPISAADLSGSCCADLEERVAELEATAASKGNRKMSLAISGSVNRLVLWWEDGRSSGTYYGLDNGNLTSRFLFSGRAKITPKVTTGFEILIATRGGGSLNISQLDEDGRIGGILPNVNTSATGPIGIPSFNAHNVDPYFADARRVFWWLEHEDLGRLSVGRLDMAGVWTTIDLTGNVFNVGSGSVVLVNGGFFIRGPAGQYYAMVWGNPAAAFTRSELVRYDSPTWKGFIYSASVAEAGDYWGTMLRYFGEHSSFRIVGQLGYERATDVATPGVVDPANVAYTGAPPIWRRSHDDLRRIPSFRPRYPMCGPHRRRGLLWRRLRRSSPGHICHSQNGSRAYRRRHQRCSRAVLRLAEVRTTQRRSGEGDANQFRPTAERQSASPSSCFSTKCLFLLVEPRGIEPLTS